MQEDFLHYIWKYRKFDFLNAKTHLNESLTILETGTHNFNSGPDFFNAKIKIENQIWAGNVEIHINSSHWYAHNHQEDKAYDNVVLHVVWEHDVDVFNQYNSPIATLELRNLVSEKIIADYNYLVKSQQWINCENQFPNFDQFTLNNWLERIYLERLEQKQLLIQEVLKRTDNNWEHVLFILLAKSFGLKINGDSFLSLAQSFDFKILQKVQHNELYLEALLFGQSGLLIEVLEDVYYNELKNEYNYILKKYSLQRDSVIPVKYFRLRPDNFPNIRLSQLAQVYFKSPNLFSKIINSDVENIKVLFSEIETSSYWRLHYNFQKAHKEKSKRLSKNFIDLLIINCIVPLKFAYSKFSGKIIDAEILQSISNISSEKNSIIEKFEKIRPNTVKSALHSQALIHLKQEYCDKNRCLNCSLGNRILSNTI